MFYFATLFDFNYLSRGLSLLNSLEKVLPNNFNLFILALDDKTEAYFSENANPNITTLNLLQIESYYPALTIAKANRNKVEYYFTLSPILPLYILENFKHCNRVTTLDADVYFFDSPAMLFENYSNDDILITPHDFPSKLDHLAQYGIYNVSFQSFPNTTNGISVLKDWKQKCLIWCKDFLDSETGYFADQKYLDDWAENFDHIKPISEKTCGRAPWNITEIVLNISNNKFYVNEEPLIYYHFHNLRIKGNLVTHDLQNYGMPTPTKNVKKLYQHYFSILNQNNRKIGLANDTGVIRYNHSANKQSLFKAIWENKHGAVLFPFNKLIFFNISRIKSLYLSFHNKISGKTH